MTFSNQFADPTVEEIRDALSCINPNTDRDQWARIGMAIKSELGADGFDVWDDWSRQGDTYDQQDARDTWRSIKASGGVGIATLFHIARENGYRSDNSQPRQIDPQEAAERKARREAEAAREAANLQEKHQRASEAAEAMWKASTSTQRHTYITKKGITKPGAVRVGTYRRWHEASMIEIADALLIPMRNASKKITGLQAYFPSADNPLDRDRDYLPGSQKQGSYFNIGVPSGEDGETILIGEGYATVASACDATNAPGIVAFDSGNLIEVARIMRSRMPNARIVMLADNDRFSKRNTGIIKATEAAREIGGLVAIPSFQSDDGGPTDFNDLYRLQGLEEVRRQIDAAKQPETADAEQAANDNEQRELTDGERALHQFVHILGLDIGGKVWILDKRTGDKRGFKDSELCKRATLIGLAPAEAWIAAAGGEKFSIDAAYQFIVGIAKSLPRFTPPKRQAPTMDMLTGQHGADSAIIAAAMREHTLFDEYSQTWYSWDAIWRPVTEGDVNRRLITLLDSAFQMQYDVSAFNGTFTLLKKRLGRPPAMNADHTAAFDAWNRDRSLLPMRNGVLDLRTKTLAPHTPEGMMSWMIPHDYDSAAECPTVVRFISQLSQGDASTEAVLYAFLAAVLHGRSDLQKYLECVGIAGTGKSTYIKICQSLVGDSNVAVTTMQQLNTNQFETANIYGKRLVVISDADKYGGTVDVFKAITGQDPVRFEEKHKQAGKPFIFSGMVIAAANQPIQFSDTSTAMVRRRIPVHLDKRLDDKAVDTELSEKLASEIPGLVNLLLDYEHDQITEILRDTDRRRIEASNRAMCETNSIAAWLNDMVLAQPGSKAKIGTLRNDRTDCLYSNYAFYCEKTGRKGMVGLQGFSRAVVDVLSHAGIQAEKTTGKYGAHITGIRLRSTIDDEKPGLLYGKSPENIIDTHM